MDDSKFSNFIEDAKAEFEMTLDNEGDCMTISTIIKKLESIRNIARVKASSTSSTKSKSPDNCEVDPFECLPIAEYNKIINGVGIIEYDDIMKKIIERHQLSKMLSKIGDDIEEICVTFPDVVAYLNMEDGEGM